MNWKCCDKVIITLNYKTSQWYCEYCYTIIPPEVLEHINDRYK